MNPNDYNATEDEAGAVDAVYDLFAQQGPYSHNMIGIRLRTIANTNKPLADAVYKDLQEQGW